MLSPLPSPPPYPAGTGTSQPGGHVQAFRAQAAFPVEAKLNVIGSNLWRPGTSRLQVLRRSVGQEPGHGPRGHQQGFRVGRTVQRQAGPNTSALDVHIGWSFLGGRWEAALCSDGVEAEGLAG